MTCFKNGFLVYPVLETDQITLSLNEFLDQLIFADVKILQLRDKMHSQAERYHTAKKISEFLKDKKDVTFIINDSIDLALAVGASGIHLGIKDIPISEARKFNSKLLLGYSCNNLTDVENANSYADYAAIGPCFYTDTKKDLRPIVDKSKIETLLSNLELPTVAIGGIDDTSIVEIKKFNFSGVALSSYITKSSEPYEAIKRLYKAGNQ